MRRDVYFGFLKLLGEEDESTLLAACNYANSLIGLKRFEEAKSLTRKTMPVAQRALGEHKDIMLRMRWSYARALCQADRATLDDLREAVTTLEDTTRIARRVLGSSHPLTLLFEQDLRASRALLAARQTPPGSS